MNSDVASLLVGGAAIDDRGSVSFCNEFPLESMKRFYVVRNHTRGFIRAWHGHRREAKAVFVASGTAMVCVVRVDDWDAPSRGIEVQKFVMSESQPRVLIIPPGFANGFMNLVRETRVVFFSNSTLEESAGDDIRFDARYWNPWDIEER